MSSQLRQIEAALEKLNKKQQTYKFRDLKTPNDYVSKDKEKKISSSNQSKFISLQTEQKSIRKKSNSSLSLPTFSLTNSQASPRRYNINPTLPMNLLKDMEAIVSKWQISLKQIQKQIHKIYAEGPLLDAWLESYNSFAFIGNSNPRKAADDHLMDYVEELSHDNVSYQSPRPGYRLCGKDENGKIWSQPCPQDQVIEVTMAISRYQKLQKLLVKKKQIESRLNHLAEGLVILHSEIHSLEKLT